MNYGEDVAYWYLRLNGFFPLTRFVVHRAQGTRLGDVDLLAVRPPFVGEEIGDRPLPYHELLAGQVSAEKSIGLICEVKTGLFDGSPLFPPERLRAAVRRLGLFPPAESEQIAAQLHLSPRYSTSTAEVAKLVIANNEWRDQSSLFISLVDAEDFVFERAALFLRQKWADRIHFPSGFFQYAIARANREYDD